MSEVDAIKAISDAFEKLDAEAQARVLNWAQSKYGGTAPAAARPAPHVHADAPQKELSSPSRPKAKAAKQPKAKAAPVHERRSHHARFFAAAAARRPPPAAIGRREVPTGGRGTLRAPPLLGNPLVT